MSTTSGRFGLACGILLFATFRPTSTTPVDHVTFLKDYGYLPKGLGAAQLSTERVGDALRQMQQMAGIAVTGQLDATTVGLLGRRRCGRADVFPEKRAKRSPTAWKQRRITFGVSGDSMRLPSAELRQALHVAAGQWSQLADVEIVEARDAMINVTVGVSRHGRCPFVFRNNELAHAFLPDVGDIHVNEEVPFVMDAYTSQRGTSLPAVIAHEMGHALGFEHSPEQDSIMYQYDMPMPRLFTTYDRMLMQHFYGKKPETRKDNGGTADTRTNDPRIPAMGGSEVTSDAVKPDPCLVQNPIVVFYRRECIVFKSDWVWKFSEDLRSLVLPPTKIDVVFRGLPGPVDAVVPVKHQLWVFVGSQVFVIDGNRIVHAPMRYVDMKIDSQTIDVAYDWHYFKPPGIYLWSDTRYWRLDEKMDYRVVDERYPRPISGNWLNVPRGVRSAFSHENELHFIKEDLLYRMNSSSSKFDVSTGYPVQLSTFFHTCPQKPKFLGLRNLSRHGTISIVFLLHLVLVVCVS